MKETINNLENNCLAQQNKKHLILKSMLIKTRIVLIVLFLVIICTLINPVFISPINLLNIVRQTSVMIIIAIGSTFIMISGGFDLSVGSTAALSGIIAAIVAKSTGNIIISITSGLCIGLIIGLINGTLISKLKLNPLIITLATMTFARGVTFLLTGGTSVYGLPESFSYLGRGHIGFLPVQVVLMVILFVIGWVVLSKTLFGRYAFAIGGNENVARLAGIKVEKYKMLYFILGGICASLGGIILVSRIGSGQPMLAQGLELNVITAIILGGASLSGGKGSVWGSAMGAFLLTIIENSLTINRVSAYWQMVVTAILLVITIIIYERRKN